MRNVRGRDYRTDSHEFMLRNVRGRSQRTDSHEFMLRNVRGRGQRTGSHEFMLRNARGRGQRTGSDDFILGTLQSIIQITHSLRRKYQYNLPKRKAFQKRKASVSCIYFLFCCDFWFFCFTDCGSVSSANSVPN